MRYKTKKLLLALENAIVRAPDPINTSHVHSPAYLIWELGLDSIESVFARDFAIQWTQVLGEVD